MGIKSLYIIRSPQFSTLKEAEGIYLPNYIASHPRTPWLSNTQAGTIITKKSIILKYKSFAPFIWFKFQRNEYFTVLRTS
jgi:hypothetical protein